MDTRGSSTREGPITLIGWIVIGVAAWLVVAAAVGVLIGRMIRNRDRQVPGRSGPLAPVDPTAPPGNEVGIRPAVGRGRRRPS